LIATNRHLPIHCRQSVAKGTSRHILLVELRSLNQKLHVGASVFDQITYFYTSNTSIKLKRACPLEKSFLKPG